MCRWRNIRLSKSVATPPNWVTTSTRAFGGLFVNWLKYKRGNMAGTGVWNTWRRYDLPSGYEKCWDGEAEPKNAGYAHLSLNIYFYRLQKTGGIFCS